MADPVVARTRPRDLTVRTISGAVYGALFIGALWAGGWILGVFLAALWVLAVWEWARLTGGALGVGVGAAGAAVVIVLTPLVAVMVGILGLPGGRLLFLLPAVGLLGVWWRWCRWTGLGLAYLGWPALLLLAVAGPGVSDGSDARVVLAWLVAVVWATDVSAYFVGRAVGGPKLAPRISPGKTKSGALGGLAGAAIAGAVAAWLLGTGGWLVLAVAAAWISIVAQVGDLFESWVKRQFGVKDAGALIPGHGGVLDRIDGLLFAVIGAIPLAALGLFAGLEPF